MRILVSYERLQSGSMQPSSRESYGERARSKIRLDHDGCSSKVMKTYATIFFDTVQACFNRAYISYISRKIAEESKYATHNTHIEYTPKTHAGISLRCNNTEY